MESARKEADKKNEGGLHHFAQIDISAYQQQGYNFIDIKPLNGSQVLIFFCKRIPTVFLNPGEREEVKHIEVEEVGIYDIAIGKKITSLPKTIEIEGKQQPSLSRFFLKKSDFGYYCDSSLLGGIGQFNNLLFYTYFKDEKSTGMIIWDCQKHCCVKQMDFGFQKLIPLNKEYFVFLNSRNICFYKSSVKNPMESVGEPLKASESPDSFYGEDPNGFTNLLSLNNNEFVVSLRNGTVKFYRFDDGKIDLIKTIDPIEKDERATSSLFFLADDHQLLVTRTLTDKTIYRIIHLRYSIQRIY